MPPSQCPDGEQWKVLPLASFSYPKRRRTYTRRP